MPKYGAVKPKSTLKDKILQDKRINKLFRMLENGDYSVDTNELISELEDLHLARRFRQFNPNTFLQSTQTNLISWQLELSATRSRAVSIKMQCFKLKRQLEEQIKNTKNYILTSYSEELKSEVSNTITGRKEFVDSILERFRRLEFKLDTVIQLTDFLISDLSESRWNNYGIVEALKIQVGRD